jgi:uncharacterized repeat protein (TIGR01451 family)
MLRILLSFTFLTAIYCNAQLPDLQRQRNFGGTGGDYLHNIIKTIDGGYILVGHTASFDIDALGHYPSSVTEFYDGWVVKMDANFSIVWKKILGGIRNDLISSVIQTPDGGYLMCGETDTHEIPGYHGGPSLYETDGWLLKLSAAGDIEWQKCLGGSGYENLLSLTATPDGNYLLCGSSGSSDGDPGGTHGGSDVWIVKIDPQGNIIWQKSFGGTNSDEGKSIVATSDGGYAFIAFTASKNGDVLSNIASYALWLVKLTSDGNISWQKAIGTASINYPGAVITDGDNIIVAGNIFYTNYITDGLVMSYTNSGDLNWQTRMGGLNIDMIDAIQKVGPDYITGGYSRSHDGALFAPYDREDFWINRLSHTGEKLETRFYGGMDRDFGNNGNTKDPSICLLPLNGNEFIFGGMTNSIDKDIYNNYGGGDVVLLKFGPTSIIKGKVFQDNNANGIKDGADTWLANDTIYSKKNFSGTRSVTDINGLFVNRVDTGSYLSFVRGVDTNLFRILPQETFSNLVAYNTYDSINFSIVPKTHLTSIAGDLTSLDDARPGLKANYRFTFRYQGARTDLDTRIYFVKDHKLLFDSSSVQPTRVSGDTLYFDYRGLLQNNLDTILMRFKVPDWPLVNGGDRLLFSYHFSPYTIDSLYFNSWDSVLFRLSYPYNEIKGTAFIDRNHNHIQDNDEPPFMAGLVMSGNNTDSVFSSLDSGMFRNLVDTGTYTTILYSQLPYYTVVPASHETAFNDYYNVDSLSFAVEPVDGVRDLAATAVSNDNPKPGKNHAYDIGYVNIGTDTVASGTFKIIKDPRTNVVSVSPAPDQVIEDSLIWNFTNLKPLEFSEIYLVVQCDQPPSLNQNDTLVLRAVVSPANGDVDSSNNNFELKELVVNSLDPNDIIESHAGRIKRQNAEKGEDLNYTVRFQNTGNAAADFVIIKDTLDSRFDINSFRMIRASHPYHLTIEHGTILKWEFSNINLPDSFSNEPQSHGYISYSIKTRKNSAYNTILNNKASIYFDFNYPIETNVSTTSFVEDVVALPVTILDFAALYKSPYGELTWRTANEIAFNRFEIERSVDGLNFAQVGKVLAHQTTGVSRYYYNDDLNAVLSSTIYYRLRLIDANGRFKYSGIIVLTKKGIENTRLIPNPVTNGRCFLYFQSNLAGLAKIDVLDQNGIVVNTMTVTIQKGSNNIQLMGLSTLSGGTYYVRFVNDSNEWKQKIIIINQRR